MRRAALLMIAACGSTAVPATKPVVVATVEKTPPRTKPTCEDMGPLLRRTFAPDGAEDDIMQTVATECTEKHWSEAVLTCVADTPELNANDCLSKLDGEQTESLNTIVAGFNGWGEHDEEAPSVPQCADVLKATDVADWNPPVVGEEQRELARELRRPAMQALCDAQAWDQEMVTCIGEAVDPGTLVVCEQGMESGLRTAVNDAVAGADVVRAKMSKVLAAPATYSCAKVVAAHYVAAKWKGQAPKIVGGSRAKVIAASKKMMRDACAAEAWSAEVRACVVAVDEPVCWTLAKVASDERTWSYPAEGTVPYTTGVAECDEWGAEVERLFKCQAVPEDLRKSLRRSFESVKASFDGLYRLPKETVQESLHATADSCRQARDTVGQLAQKAGC